MKLTNEVIEIANLFAFGNTGERLKDEEWMQISELFLNSFVNLKAGEKLAKIKVPKSAS